MVKLLGIQIQFTRALDLDAMNCVFFTGRKRIAGGKDLLQDRYGIVYKLSKHGEPFPVDGPVKGPEDMKTSKLMMPDPADFIMLKFVRGSLPERAVLLTLPGTFRFSWSVMGAMDRLLLAYIQEPEFALDLARITTYFTKGVVEAGKHER